MPDPDAVSTHYARVGLIETIRSALETLGRSTASVTLDDLAPVDEFHMGGREATEQLVGQLGLAADDRVLDVGCGLGGAARVVAARHGCRVTGIDLTAGYVEAGTALCRWTGLDRRIDLHHGSALAMPFADARFDAAYMMHVGMNVADKAALCAEVRRVLRAGATFGLYDVTRTGEGDLVYPLPWADAAENSVVATPAAYRATLEEAGFEVLRERDRRDFALDFFARMRARAEAAGGAPPLGIHLLMGDGARAKVENMVASLAAGRIAPIEIIARVAA